MICNLNSFGFLEKQASDLLLTSPVRWNWTYEGTSSGCKFLDWPFDSKRKAMCGGDHSLKPFAGLREDWAELVLKKRGTVEVVYLKSEAPGTLFKTCRR